MNILPANDSASALLCLLPHVTLRPARTEHPAVRAARQYMEDHFCENISVAKLAALVSLSPYHFARVFVRQTSFPPHAYLEGIRIRKAREFLDCGHTLASAALSAGFADQSHMTHRFKRFLGITPGEYVRQHKIRLRQEQDPIRRSATGRAIYVDSGLYPGI
jgi:AraC-like DNA-binding protein